MLEIVPIIELFMVTQRKPPLLKASAAQRQCYSVFLNVSRTKKEVFYLGVLNKLGSR